jgi:type IV fimbrial biogenesis protein FimT
MDDSRRRCRRAPRGFTMIEGLVVLAVAAVLLGVAAPDFSRTLSERALAVQASQFMSALRFARSEAVKRGQPVVVCASDAAAPGVRCQPEGRADWRAGWIVFVDPAGDEGPEPARLLRVQQPFARTGGIEGTRSEMTFTAAGFSVNAASHFRFQPPGGAKTGGVRPILVCVSKQGRPRVARGEVCE